MLQPALKLVRRAKLRNAAPLLDERLQTIWTSLVPSRMTASKALDPKRLRTMSLFQKEKRTDTKSSARAALGNVSLTRLKKYLRVLRSELETLSYTRETVHGNS